MSVESFPLFSLSVFPPTSSADSNTTFVRVSFKHYVSINLVY